MTGRHNGAAPRRDAAFNPFEVPHEVDKLVDAAVRSRVAVRGSVEAVEPVAWVGGPVLEVALADSTDTITLAFLGRETVGGVRPGRCLTAAGTVGTHCGRRVILNPTIWLDPTPAARSDQGMR